MTDLQSLRERVSRATGPDRELDEAVMALFYTRDKRHIGTREGPEGSEWEYMTPVKDDVWVDPANDKWVSTGAFDFTRSIDAAIALALRLFPGWWITSGLCALSGHASIGPDYNGPDRERLLKEFPQEIFDAGFDADLAPGDGIHRQCLAIIDVALQAKIAVAALEARSQQT